MKPGGFFITFEGGEGSGKSTHIQFVASYFKKKRKHVLVVREPGSTKIGEEVRKILLDPKHRGMFVETELFLYLAARAQLVREVIRPALEEGIIVISDRFEDSTLVYQGYAGGVPVSKLRHLVKYARSEVLPHLTFLLDLAPEAGLRRSGRKDRIEKKPMHYHKKIQSGFRALARKYPKRFAVISSDLSKQEVQKKIEVELNRAFSRLG
jgi:dTMP kinase